MGYSLVNVSCKKSTSINLKTKDYQSIKMHILWKTVFTKQTFVSFTVSKYATLPSGTWVYYRPHLLLPDGWYANGGSGVQNWREAYDIAELFSRIVYMKHRWKLCAPFGGRICSIAEHYDDVIMTTMASQITSQPHGYLLNHSDADQIKHQSTVSLAFGWGIHRDRWIPRTKGQLRGKCFHLMASSWINLVTASNLAYDENITTLLIYTMALLSLNFGN